MAASSEQMQVLRPVGVLVLVHQDLLPASLVARQHVGVLLEQEDGAHQQVVEVHRVVLVQLALVGLVDPGRGLVVVVGRLPLGGGDVRQLVLALPDPGQHPRRREALLVQVQAAQHLLDDRHLVRAVVDREGPGQADLLAVAAQDPGADGVEGADGRLARRLLPDQPGDPLAHLVGRLVGEGDGHDLPRLRPGGHQVGHAVRQHPRLAAARPGQDQQRPAGVCHRLALRRVEARQDVVRRARRGGSSGLRGHRSDSSPVSGGTMPNMPAAELPACVFCGQPIGPDQEAAGRPPMAAHVSCADAALADDTHWDAISGSTEADSSDSAGNEESSAPSARAGGCLAIALVLLAVVPLVVGQLALV